MCFMLHDFVATRISFGCSLSPLHLTCSVQASTVITAQQQLLTLLSVLEHVTCWYMYLCIIFSLHDFAYFLFIFLYKRTTAEAEGEVMSM